MILLDANILLYAYNADAPQHRPARQWLDQLFASAEWVGIPWVTLWAFVRISTNPRLMPQPLPIEDAFGIIRDLLDQSRAQLVEPGRKHAEILHRLVLENQAAGPALTDAVLAALAVEQGSTLASADRGFARFRELKWVNPLALPPVL